uniref:Bromodomain adjacent to zinc finger domain protein 1A n=2 Tax=Lygus hesperus TaxID=30085 RepID=A0A0K8T8G0_LYGHE
MPLLHKKPFSPEEYPFDLKESDEVFVCHSTGEIFKDYDDFCERIILCNSLVWSCSLTGRSHLTYQEAAASEDKVKRLLKRFPMELREPVLFLSSICERRSLVELAEEVFSFVKDRFFIGETVEVEFPEGQVSCHVLSVVPPTEQELEALKGKKDKDERHFPPASAYKYEVERMDNGKEATVDSSQVSRKKSAYSKDKNRLYIKQFVRNDQGIWRLKESTNTKYGINKIKFSKIFCGDAPDMNPKKPQKQRKPSPDKMKKQGTINNYFKSSSKKFGLSPRKSPKKGEMSTTDLKKARRRRRSKKEIEEDKVKDEAMKKEMKLKKKALIMESRAKYNEFVRKWNMKREDLECEDLKELPNLHPVECKNLANEYFGDVAMFMEFFYAFNRILETKDFFPHGISFELLARSVTVNEPAGPLSDILQLLICRIFGLLEGELEEIKQTDLKVNPYFIFDRRDSERKKLSALAARTEMWVRKHHGVPLDKLQLDTSTISEMVRLHLLTSGSMSDKSKEAKWRYQARGGYCNSDDPGIQLRIDHPEIIEKLGSQSIFELETGEKIEVIRCLMNQILTYSATRDIIEEGCEKAKQCRVELRALRAEQTRKEKEEAIRLKDLKKAGLLTADQQAEAEKEKEKEDGGEKEETTRERELRSGIIGEKKPNIQTMTHELNEALRSAQMAPLGMDRAHRRYWLFPSVPGLFVEDCVSDKGPCLPKCTPSATFNHEDSMAYIKRLFKESSNKENISDKQENILTPSPKKLLSEKNGETTPIPRTRTKSESQPLLPLTCWADPENCPVHGINVSRPMWSYVKDQNELERLIQSLNMRGVRERKLRESLVDEKEKIVQILEDFPIHLFSAVGEDYELDANVKLRNHKILKPYESSFCGYPKDCPLDDIVEGTLRDLILETEEKISAGALGYLKVKDRDVWRSAIANNSYDKQCKLLTWGSRTREEDEEQPIEVEEMEVDDEDETDSRCSTPSLEVRSSSTRSYPKGFTPVPQRQVVQDLASAIIQSNKA